MSNPLDKIRVSPPTASIPDLTWIGGKVHQIFLQDKERFYLVVLEDGTTMRSARFGDAYTGKLEPLSATNPMYALIQQAFYRKVRVDLGVRDFGPDPQSGINKVIIDRVAVQS